MGALPVVYWERAGNKLEVYSMKITKRNGSVVLYDDEKVAASILKAAADAAPEKLSEKMALAIADEVFAELSAEEEIITTREIRDRVYLLLCNRGFPMTARQYLEFRK